MLTRDQFLEGWREAFAMSEEEGAALFDRIDAQRTRDFISGRRRRQTPGEVDVSELSNAIKLSQMGTLVQRCRAKGRLYHAALDEEECAALRRLLDRLDQVAARAKALDVRLMIDAEHTYFQPAIDHAVLRLSRRHNTTFPCVFGTYQAYLLDSSEKLSLDLARSEREGWHIGAKLVRGAYMVHERERARERGYADPIQPTAEATHSNYDAMLDTLLLHCPCPERTSLMVATHNRSSVERVAAHLLAERRRAQELGGASSGGALPHSRQCTDDDSAAAASNTAYATATAATAAAPSRVPTGNVSFGQLLGMADHLTFTLASHGLKAYKYVPYGPVREVLPYLMRRAQENADALSGAAEQRNMMLAEVRRRWIGRVDRVL